MVSSLTREYVTPANTKVASFCKMRMMHRDCFSMGDDESGIEYGMSFLTLSNYCVVASPTDWEVTLFIVESKYQLDCIDD